jgi:antitoxin component of RelBE/YafQ-DinJ toxin-antitoxin module
MSKGIFTMATPETVLKESKVILENLQVHGRFLSDHISNYIPLEGKLPEDKERMLKMIKDTLKSLEEDRDFRERMWQKKYLRHL